MTTMPESLNSPVSGKNVFMEFGPPSQQMSPSSMSHGHYSMHCLHSAGHSQHESSYSPASSFPRSLGYPYVNSVGSHSSSPYISAVQTYPNNTALTQTRLEDAGKNSKAFLNSCFQKSCGMDFRTQIFVSFRSLAKVGLEQSRCAGIRVGNYLLRNAINNVCN